jgi:hypothetical protein
MKHHPDGDRARDKDGDPTDKPLDQVEPALPAPKPAQSPTPAAESVKPAKKAS